MIDGNYLCRMDTPMGEIKGNVKLQTKGEELYGTIEIMGMKQSFSGGKVSGNQCVFKGESKSMIGTITYEIVGKVVQDNIEIIANTNKGKFNIKGKRI